MFINNIFQSLVISNLGDVTYYAGWGVAIPAFYQITWDLLSCCRSAMPSNVVCHIGRGAAHSVSGSAESGRCRAADAADIATE